MLYLFKLGITTLTRPIRFEAILIEEIELPRPHYKARLNVQMFRDPETTSATFGLIPNEIAITVHVPVDVGTDLKVIKQAAINQALDDIKLLMQLSAEPHAPCHQSVRRASSSYKFGGQIS